MLVPGWAGGGAREILMNLAVEYSFPHWLSSYDLGLQYQLWFGTLLGV